MPPAAGFVSWRGRPSGLGLAKAGVIAGLAGGSGKTLVSMALLLGATFVSMQAFEWTHLILTEGVRPWGNPLGAAQFGASFFMITGFHGMHVTAGVIYLSVIAYRVGSGFYDRKKGGNYETVEIAGLYWHFVDLVWVFIFAFFYLW